MEYNLVHELQPEELSLCKEEEHDEPEVKCEMLDESATEERYRQNRYIAAKTNTYKSILYGK